MLTEEQAKKLKENLFSQIEKMPADQVAGLKEKIVAMSPQELEQFMAQQQQATQQKGPVECLFCGIIAGKVETTKVYEDENVVAILDINPINPGHTIVMPKKHHQFLFQLPEPLLLNLMKVVNFLSEVLVNVTKSTGINVQLAMGESAGQRVPHLTFNLIPRNDTDGISFEANRKSITKEELSKISNEIKERVEKAKQEQQAQLAQQPPAAAQPSAVVQPQAAPHPTKEEKKEKTEAEKMLKHVKKRMP